MKIWCDVCNKDEASVFCTADDAALCDACDHRVHHANKLAGKHQRFSLLHPSPKQFPLCDICQEKRAFLFCQQDRAILCRDCDLPIHRANENTQKHNRFLLTGVKLSPTSAIYSSSSSSSDNDGGGDVVPNLGSQNSINNPISAQPAIPNATALAITSTDKGLESNQVASSISEYLIEMLPGWRVEDFLDSFPASFGFSEGVDDILPNWVADLENNLGSFSSPQKMGIWVPQAPPPPPCPSQHPSSNMTTFGYESQISLNESKETTTNKSGMKYRVDGCFTVPQISPPSTTVSKKRSRTSW